MATTLATELRRDFDHASANLPKDASVLVERARDTVNVSPAERDRLLAEVVTAYRRGPRELWSPVILDLLAPALIDTVRRIERKSQEISDLCDPQERLNIDEDELRQQLVLEVLGAAATIPIHLGGRAMKVRLLRHASRYVVRWLKRELRHQITHCSLEALEASEEEGASDGNGNHWQRAREIDGPVDGN